MQALRTIVAFWVCAIAEEGAKGDSDSSDDCGSAAFPVAIFTDIGNSIAFSMGAEDKRCRRQAIKIAGRSSRVAAVQQPCRAATAVEGPETAADLRSLG